MALKDTIRIMVVDDMSTSRGLLIQGLDHMGIKNYEFAGDGLTAMQKISANPVNLVVSDYNMPNMNGLQLLKSLREQKATRGIGFILVTGSEDPKLIDAGRKLGLNNFLKKPFTPQSLKACIEAVVGKL